MMTRRSSRRPSPRLPSDSRSPGSRRRTAEGLVQAARPTSRLASEVPRPTGVPVGATGAFTGKAVELANDKAKLTWRLTFSKLSGRRSLRTSMSASPGRPARCMVALCGPCKSGQRGTATISHAQLAKHRGRRDVRERPHGEERRRRDPRADQGLGRRLGDWNADYAQSSAGEGPTAARSAGAQRHRRSGELRDRRVNVAHLTLEPRAHAGTDDADAVDDETTRG